MNKVILMGRLARDPEVRYTANGTCVATLTIATDRPVSRDNAGSAPSADFIPCVAWDRTAELAGNYLAKGRQVLVEGSNRTRRYESKDGTKRYVMEVVIDRIEFIGSKSDNTANNGSGVADTNQQASFAGKPVQDDIPF